ncbi:FtsH protease activity modulator HflK [Pseudoroseicyclus tamaricis]|uniref:Protein HflK n=1 Tax=Pseudoroseicyclus tamaricis TaxID=2705421 RepID=A0A6B2JQ52_9RHOB|nr:FtsH protease activity modulator HflK [Pseudoroseicyclus tamaricis]NDV00150.1 FtsH protease activity modulator HflK [Pseudoroseicyclus tamaricis]
MAGNSQGPWGGGGRGPGNGNDENGQGGGRDGGRRPGGRRPGQDGQQGSIPEIDDLMNRGREQLRVLMGGGGNNRAPNNGTGGGGGGGDFRITRGTVGIAALVVVALWAFMSFYTVRPEEQSVELLFGRYSSTGDPGLNFAPWPFVTHEVVNVTSERTESIGTSGTERDQTGLMLTTDANIVDINFQVVWNVADPARFLFNIAEPEETVQAVSESVMREVIAASTLAPILNRDRGLIAQQVQEGIQDTLDEYESGINIVRVNLEKADPPMQVIDAFRNVQAAEQERDRLQRQADAYSNRVLAEARGLAAQIVEQAEAYRAETVNDALGQASRFSSVLEAYNTAEDVTRRRLYLETMEEVLGGVNKIILDPTVAGGTGGQGVVPYLPLNELGRSSPSAAAPNSASTQTGGN